MFDIGFWELAIIGVVALLVIGPERLPAVARTMGHWLGKAKQFVGSVQADINQEIGKSEELSRLLKEQSKIKEIHEIIEQTVDETKRNVSIGAKLNEHQQKPMPQATEHASDQSRGQLADDQVSKLPNTSSVNDQAK